MALSPGCTAAHNMGLMTDVESILGWIDGHFAAGERLTVSAGQPGGPGGGSLKLFIENAPGDMLVACAGYPGTVGYTFLWGENVSWEVMFTGGPTVTWTIDCGLAPPFNPTQEITDLKARVAGLPVASSVKAPLIYYLDRALENLGRAVLGRGSRPINRGLGLFRRSSTVARFLDWAWADPCSLLWMFILQVRAAKTANQITETQWCELEYTATDMRRMFNCLWP
jgi:hypothetical protein